MEKMIFYNSVKFFISPLPFSPLPTWRFNRLLQKIDLGTHSWLQIQLQIFVRIKIKPLSMLLWFGSCFPPQFTCYHCPQLSTPYWTIPSSSGVLCSLLSHVWLFFALGFLSLSLLWPTPTYSFWFRSIFFLNLFSDPLLLANTHFPPCSSTPAKCSTVCRTPHFKSFITQYHRCALYLGRRHGSLTYTCEPITYQVCGYRLDSVFAGWVKA